VRSCAIFQGRFKASTSDNKDAGERADKRTGHMYVKAEMSHPREAPASAQPTRAKALTSLSFVSRDFMF
jgi:hypothetical protein